MPEPRATAGVVLPRTEGPRGETRGRMGIGRRADGRLATIIALVAIWILSRVPGLVGFVLAQRAQGQPAGWTQLAARWDGEWYVLLATHGYPTTLDLPGRPLYGPWGFFPFWPWTIRLVSSLIGGHPGVAAALATAVSGLFVIAAVWGAAALVGGRRAAYGAALLFAFFPGSLSLTMPYTEGSFLFWSIIALIALGGVARDEQARGRWFALGSRPRLLTATAALAAFLACGTRSTGIAVLVAVAVHAIVSAARSRRVPWGDAAIAAAGVLGTAVDLLFAWRTTGDPFIWRRAQAQWHQVFDWGRGLIVAFTETIPDHGPDYRAWTVMLVMSGVLLAAVAVAAVSWRRIPVTWWAYTVTLLGLMLLWSSVGPRPRMLLALFPVFIAVAMTAMRARRAVWLIVGSAVALCAAASVVYAYAVFYVPWHVTA